MTAEFKQNIGKKEITDNIKSTIGFSSKNIQKITDDIIASITEILIYEKNINIKNFGSFNISYKNQREGRNPKTKEKFTINSRNIVKFKASNFIKKKIKEL